MKVEVQLYENVKERKVIIVTDAVDAEIEALLQKLGQDQPQLLAGFDGDRVVLLEQRQILRIYAQTGKVLAVTDRGEFVLKLRLYELEERLDRGSFARISNSEIVNLRWVKNFDLSYSGTIRVALANGDSAFVSRRYLKKIKSTLGL